MPPRLHTYVIGLGANLGDRLSTLRQAVGRLESLGRRLAISQLYETDPVAPPQPDYLNAALLLETALAPAELLDALLAIERELGRERRERWGPRTLDLDLLYGPNLIVNEPSLTLPHPELHRRAFALVPLLEVAPDAVDPVSGARYEALAQGLDVSGLRPVETFTPGRAEWLGSTVLTSSSVQ
jgi:2-amino-4-hydroxy-6-hydroxymethyldihydropteridine diphosphokinase